jgi:hypothetical protein
MGPTTPGDRLRSARASLRDGVAGNVPAASIDGGHRLMGGFTMSTACGLA